MAEHHGEFRLSSMCRVLRVQRSGYYAWKAKPKSDRALADEVMLVSIKQFFEDSQGIYGSPRVHRDLREEGIRCGEKRVARLMQQAQLRSVRGYKRPATRWECLRRLHPIACSASSRWRTPTKFG